MVTCQLEIHPLELAGNLLSRCWGKLFTGQCLIGVLHDKTAREMIPGDLLDTECCSLGLYYRNRVLEQLLVVLWEPAE